MRDITEHQQSYNTLIEKGYVDMACGLILATMPGLFIIFLRWIQPHGSAYRRPDAPNAPGYMDVAIQRLDIIASMGKIRQDQCYLIEQAGVLVALRDVGLYCAGRLQSAPVFANRLDNPLQNLDDELTGIVRLPVNRPACRRSMAWKIMVSAWRP